MMDDADAMQWYYADKGTSTGPIPAAQFEAMAADGRLGPDVLVWREGMDGWKPLREIRTPGPAPEQDPASASAAGKPVADEPAASCSQCGRPFPPADLLRFGDTLVCATCKPAFVQRIQEDAVAPRALQYGGFWIRFAATFIDGIVISIAQYAVYIPVILAVARSSQSPDNPWPMLVAQMLLALFSMLLTAGYEIWMVGRFGATLGKMACRLRVVTAEGASISYGRATGRHFAKYVSYFTMYIGFIIAGFDREKRSLHDMICNTRVVKV